MLDAEGGHVHLAAIPGPEPDLASGTFRRKQLRGSFANVIYRGVSGVAEMS
jgi:hypothetical protein